MNCTICTVEDERNASNGRGAHVSAVEDEHKAAVHHLSPADAAAVVQRHERRAAERVADHILH